MAFGFRHLARQLTGATQTVFTGLLAQPGGENIYSFALYSDEDALTVCPSATTLETIYLATQPPEDQAYAKSEPAE